jgi:hypothetical protein
MKANEVRIGNYIKFHNTITKVEGFSIWDNLIQSDNFAERELKDFEPIPLTEEWLLRFGFNKDYKSGYLGIDVHNSDFVLTEPKKMGEWQNGYVFQFTAGNVPKFKEIFYVHKLQNLYFALTGEELTIKENE